MTNPFEGQTLYEILGVETFATVAEIKAGHRKMAKVHHPDKPGGSAEAMEQINEAYRVLGDPQERSFYDRNGVPNTIKTTQADIDKFMRVNFENMIIAGALERGDLNPFSLISDALNRNLGQERIRIPAAEKEIVKLREQKGQLVFRDHTRPCPLEVIFDEKITTQEDIIKNANIAIHLIEATLKQMHLYGWNPKPSSREGSFQLDDFRRRPTRTDELMAPREYGRFRDY